MPSPIGHALAGIAAGWLVDPAPAAAAMHSDAIRAAAIFGLAAVLPDLDLLAGAHSGPTHGIGAAAIAGGLAWWLARQSGTAMDRLRFASAVAIAYASHICLDWLGSDSTPPIGVMALWPFSREYYESPVHVFLAISRRYWLTEFWTYNLRALARELAILVPVVVAVGLLRRPRS